jgi:hypothetical protein
MGKKRNAYNILVQIAYLMEEDRLQNPDVDGLLQGISKK